MGYFATCSNCGKRTPPYTEGRCDRCYRTMLSERIKQLQAELDTANETMRLAQAYYENDEYARLGRLFALTVKPIILPEQERKAGE